MKSFKKLAAKLGIALLSAGLVAGNFSVSAAAKETSVSIPQEAQIFGTGNKISGIRVSGIDAPVPGKPFDTEAVVTAANGNRWVLPVMWMDENKVPAGPIAENKTYYPVLVYYMPFGTVMDPADGNQILLDEKTTALFGMRGILSVYDREHQFTLILPGDLYLPQQTESGSGESPINYWAPPAPAPAPSYTPAPSSDTTPEDQGDQGSQGEQGDQGGQGDQGDQEGQDETDPLDLLVAIHCSQSAQDAFSNNMEELKELVDIIVNRIQPQAVNLLNSKFSSFGNGKDNGEIGKEISLYVYYKRGDADGIPEHANTPPEALAYVSGGMTEFTDNSIRYCYMVAVDAACFTVKDNEGNPVLNRGESTDAASNMDDLDNTIVHELFHAFMDDYNRTGMAGCTDPNDLYYGGTMTDEEVDQRYKDTRFPSWFVEGSASLVENVFQYRQVHFQEFRTDYTTGGEKPVLLDDYTTATLSDAYINSGFGGDYISTYMDLEKADDPTASGKTSGSRYVSGYLACLYLSKMAAAQKLGRDAMIVDPETNEYSFSSEIIRAGMDQILTDLHNGATLDQEIWTISNGHFTDTDDFTKRFVKGTYNESENVYYTDEDSTYFCVDFLNYLNSVGQGDLVANGSILYDFDMPFTTPLNRTQEAVTDTLVIVDSNSMVVSTVPNDMALAGGGKSRSGAQPDAVQQAEAPAEEETDGQYQQTAAAMAAKEAVEPAEAETVEPEVTEPVEAEAAEAAAEPEEAAGPAECAEAPAEAQPDEEAECSEEAE